VSDARQSRATARGDWPIRTSSLTRQPSDDLCQDTTAEQRLAMMWDLAISAWTLAGREVPDYSRHEAPGRVVRPRR